MADAKSSRLAGFGQFKPSQCQGNRIMDSLDKQGIADRTNRSYRTNRNYSEIDSIGLIGPIGPTGPIGPIGPTGPTGPR